MRTVARLVALLALLFCVRGMTWKPCSSDDASFKATEVTLTPDPPKAGGQVSFHVKGSSSVAVEGGTLVVDVKYSGIPIYSTEWDLCEHLQPCPLQPGDLEIVYDQDLPIITPPGPYIVELRPTDEHGEELMCLEVHFTVNPSRYGGQVAGLQPARKTMHFWK